MNKYEIPIMDISKQISSIREELENAINLVLDSGNFVQGEFVARFEEAFAKEIGSKYAVATNSGTSALHLALLSSGVCPDDEVIIPGMTFIATASSVIYSGAKPVLVDVDRQNWVMDPDAIEGAISDKTRAIMPVHLHGRMADLEAISRICQKYDLLLIEDAAQAHLAVSESGSAGAVGDVAGFSFYPGKNLGACGEGGMLTTNSIEIANKARLLRDWGAKKKYHHDYFGYNYRMDAIQGAILSVKLKYLDRWTSLREIVFQEYSKRLLDNGFWLPQKVEGKRQVHHVLSTLVKDRDLVIDKMNQLGINVGCHYPNGIHQHKGLQGKIKTSGKLKNTEFFAEYNLSLPIYPELSLEDIDVICSYLIKNVNPVVV